MTIKGRLFDISKGCVDDGPGLRTVVFLKGCRLDCPWCHNLEGKSFKPEIAFDITLCIGCGKCLETCPRDWPISVPDAWRDGCRLCGRCAEACPSRARRLAGREYTVDELVADVMHDDEFFSGTGGGITFSGGEPLAQPAFLFACAEKLKSKGIHLAVETSGYWPGRLAGKLVEHFDLVLLDIKHVDPGKFRKATGKNIKTILSNQKRLMNAKIDIELRLPLIPGFNDSRDDLASIARWLKRCGKTGPLRLLPFHRLAVAKQSLFSRVYPYNEIHPHSDEQVAEARQILKGEGIAVEASP